MRRWRPVAVIVIESAPPAMAQAIGHQLGGNKTGIGLHRCEIPLEQHAADERASDRRARRVGRKGSGVSATCEPRDEPFPHRKWSTRPFGSPFPARRELLHRDFVRFEFVGQRFSPSFTFSTACLISETALAALPLACNRLSPVRCPTVS